MVVIVGKIMVVEVEEIVEFGILDLVYIYIFGIYVDCVIQGMFEKCIECCVMVKQEVVMVLIRD